jgi:hypothetical protein
MRKHGAWPSASVRDATGSFLLVGYPIGFCDLCPHWLMFQVVHGKYAIDIDCAGSVSIRCEHFGAADMYFAASSVLKRSCTYPLGLTSSLRQHEL